MKVTLIGRTKKDVEFLQSCARSFANTLRFVYIHNMGNYYDICYSIDVLQQNRINEIEASNLHHLTTNKRLSLFAQISRWLTSFIR